MNHIPKPPTRPENWLDKLQRTLDEERAKWLAHTNKIKQAREPKVPYIKMPWDQ